MVNRSQSAALRRARSRSAARPRPGIAELSRAQVVTRYVEVKRPTSEEIAALPPALQERAFDPYTRSFLGDCHFGRISSDEVKAALDTYREVSFLFEDARLSLAVALHRSKRRSAPRSG